MIKERLVPELAMELRRRGDPAGCTQGTVNGAKVDCRTFHIGHPMKRWCLTCLLQEAADELEAAKVVPAQLAPTQLNVNDGGFIEAAFCHHRHHLDEPATPICERARYHSPADPPAQEDWKRLAEESSAKHRSIAEKAMILRDALVDFTDDDSFAAPIVEAAQRALDAYDAAHEGRAVPPAEPAPPWANVDAPGVCRRGHTERQPKCPACHDMRIAMYEAGEPTTACEGDCNPHVARCGAKFCTYEDMADHDQYCAKAGEPAPAPEDKQ